MTGSDFSAALIGAGVALVVALVTSTGAFLLQRSKLREELRTEFMAESAIRLLLNSQRYPKRSFLQLQHRIGGFTDNELRQKLVRAGAVRFTIDGYEYWGLISRNLEYLDASDVRETGPSVQTDPRPDSDQTQ